MCTKYPFGHSEQAALQKRRLGSRRLTKIRYRSARIPNFFRVQPLPALATGASLALTLFAATVLLGKTKREGINGTDSRWPRPANPVRTSWGG